MRKQLIVGVLVAAVIVSGIGVLLSCGKQAPQSVKTGSTMEKEVKIGVILPLSGDGASYGKKERDGVALAIEEASTALGGKIRIIPIYEDTQGLPAQAVSAAQKLITVDKVSVIIGEAFSSPTLAVVPIADKNQVVVMSPSASSPKLSGSSLYFFRVWPSDTAEASKMADVAVDKLGLQSFSVLYGNNEYALGLKDVFVNRMNEIQKKIITVEAFNEGDSDFRAQLTKIKSGTPDGIYMVGYYKEFVKILKQAKELGITARFLSCGTFHEPELPQLAGGAAEGVVFVQPYFDRSSKDPVTQAFVSAYEKKFGEEAGVYSAHGYDAAKIICDVIGRGLTSSQEIQKGLLDMKDFPCVTGKTTFIKGGDVTKPARVMTVLNGQFSDLQSFE